MGECFDRVGKGKLLVIVCMHTDVFAVFFTKFGVFISFGAEKLTENFNALMGAIVKAKPSAAKGQYIRSCVCASTMGPGVKINAAKLM